jgi:hypothetical protein
LEKNVGDNIRYGAGNPDRGFIDIQKEKSLF